MATACGDKTNKIWEVSTITNWTLIQTYTNHTNEIISLEYIKEDTMASGDLDGIIHIWSISTGITIRTISAGSQVFSLKLLNNRFYLIAGVLGFIKIYDSNTGDLLSTLSAPNLINDLVLISPDLLASSSNEWKVRIWNLTTNTCKFVLSGHTNCVIGMKLVSSDILASVSYDSTVKLWNITNGTLIRTLSNHTGSIPWSVDMYTSLILISGGYQDFKINIWNVNTGELLNTIITGTSIRSLIVLNSTSASMSN